MSCATKSVFLDELSALSCLQARIAQRSEEERVCCHATAFLTPVRDNPARRVLVWSRPCGGTAADTRTLSVGSGPARPVVSDPGTDNEDQKER